jgi:hypothetical protein
MLVDNVAQCYSTGVLCQVLIRALASQHTLCALERALLSCALPASLFEQDRASLDPVHCCTVKRSQNRQCFVRPTDLCWQAALNALLAAELPALQLQCLKRKPVNCRQPTPVGSECEQHCPTTYRHVPLCSQSRWDKSDKTTCLPRTQGHPAPLAPRTSKSRDSFCPASQHKHTTTLPREAQTSKIAQLSVGSFRCCCCCC